MLWHELEASIACVDADGVMGEGENQPLLHERSMPRTSALKGLATISAQRRNVPGQKRCR